jgi:acetylornithine aminotransferase
MVATYSRPPPVFVRGSGSCLWDIENRKYLDFTAGIAVNSLGHCDPEISKLLAQQVRGHSDSPHLSAGFADQGTSNHRPKP